MTARPTRGAVWRRVPCTMNRTETKYAALLELRRFGGQVLWWGYECWTFKLGPDVRYTPDFIVMLADGSLEAHEVKGGFYRDDARAKFRIAAGLFPLVFRWCVHLKGQWEITTPHAGDR